MVNLDLIISEVSMFIFENDNLTENELDIKIRDFIDDKWDYLLPCHISYIIDKAYEIYNKI